MLINDFMYSHVIDEQRISESRRTGQGDRDSKKSNGKSLEAANEREETRRKAIGHPRHAGAFGRQQAIGKTEELLVGHTPCRCV